MSIDRRPLPMTTLQHAALIFAIKVKNKKGWESLPPLLIQAICGRYMTAPPHKSLREMASGDWIKFDPSLDGYVIDEGSLPSHPERLIGPRAPELGDTEVRCLLSHWDAGERALGDSHFTSMTGKSADLPAAGTESSKPPVPAAATRPAPAPLPPKPASRPQPSTVKVTPPAKKEEAPMSITTDSTEPIKVNPQQYRALGVIQQFAAGKTEQRFVTGDLREPFGLANIPILPANAVFQLKQLGLIKIVEPPKIGTTGAYIYSLEYGKKYFTGAELVVELIDPVSSSAPKPSEPPAKASDSAPADPPPAPTGDVPPAATSTTTAPIASSTATPTEPEPTASATAAPTEEAPAPAATSDANPAVEGSLATTVVAVPEPVVLSQEDAELLEDLQAELDALALALTGNEAELDQLRQAEAPKRRKLRVLEALSESYQWNFNPPTEMATAFAGPVADSLATQQFNRMESIKGLRDLLDTPKMDELRRNIGLCKANCELFKFAMANIRNKPPTG